MFDIAWTEILIVAVIAIIVVGPKELPGMLRAFGKTFGQVRRTAREFQSTFNDALREAERQAGLDDVKKDIDEVRSIDPTKDLKKGLMQAQDAMNQKVTDAPKNLLRQAGFKVVEPKDSHLCCGSAGTYNLLQPAIANELKARKVKTLESTAPQVIAAGNIGCLMQIGSGTTVPILHSVQLLDWATGGPCPETIRDLAAQARKAV
ncbi:MAG: Sec-independent protein translocase protein TatB [Pseudomonadota bacterium]